MSWIDEWFGIIFSLALDIIITMSVADVKLVLVTFLDTLHYFPDIKYVAINSILGSKFVSGTSVYAFLVSPP